MLVDGYGRWSHDTKRHIAFLNPAKGFYAGSALFVTTDGGRSWSPSYPHINEQALHMEFTNRRLGWVLTEAGFYASTDGGVSWGKRADSLGWVYFDMIDSLTGWAVSPIQRAKTTDGGFTWTSSNFDPPPNWVRGVQFYDKNLGVIFEVMEASYTTSNLVTTDGGDTWTRYPITSPRSPSSWAKMKFTGPDHLWFAEQHGLWLSRDSAKTWAVFDSSLKLGQAFDMENPLHGMVDVFADSVDITKDGGLSWSRHHRPYPVWIFDLAIAGRSYGDYTISYLAGNDGTIFVDASDGWDIRAVDSYTVSPLYTVSVFREGNQADVWILGSSFEILHTTLEVTGVHQLTEDPVKAYTLFVNYPNPFNPKTVVRSQTPEASNVRIVIYDLLGREVKVLVNERRAAGRYEDAFDGSGLASGVYIYRMTAGAFTRSKRMLLIK